jgi:hypothetical protein
LAKAVKYRIEFYSKDGNLCQADFLYEGYTAGIVYYIDGGARPFVLREFNTDDNLFKAIRPFLAEIQIVTNSSSVNIDNFLADQDTDIELRFYCAGTLYWSGFVLQDDFQEVYEDQNHILIITATEALGLLKDRQLSDEGVEIEVKKTPYELIEICLQESSKPLVNYTLVNNLYHTSMTSTLPDTSLNQCLIDPRTFETSPRTYEDCYTVLDKVNTAFNQTIFQYENRWFINRIEDLYTNGNLRGYTKVGGVSTSFNKRFDLEVGENSEIKPIAPQMLRFINRKPKETIVTFNYDRLAEVIKNSSFSRGNLLATYPSDKLYEVNNWLLFPGIDKPERYEIFESKFGALIDNYVKVPQISPTVNYMESESVFINFGEKVNFSVDFKYEFGFGTKQVLSIAQVIIRSFPLIYVLMEDGNWQVFSPTYTNIKVEFNGGDNVIPNEWNNIQVDSLPAPISGELTVYLYCDVTGEPINSILFKNFDFEITNRADGYLENLTGIEAKFTKPQDLKTNNNYDLHLNDYISESYKGLIYEMDGITPTDFEWYRFRYNGERQSFKKQNAISHWSHDRYDRDKIDASFYGLTWNDAGALRVIGLLNTIKLVDDLPNKIFYISNLKELDFYNATWSCTMEEVWDESRDGAAGITRSLTLNTTTGTFPNISKVPYNASTNPDFVVAGDGVIIYQGAEPITETLTISLSGNFIAYIGATPVLVEFYVKQNGTTIRTQSFTISGAAPFPFSLNLSPVGSYTINPQDEIEVSFAATEAGKSITSIQFTGGTFNVSSYGIPNTLNYDPYSEKYLFR